MERTPPDALAVLEFWFDPSHQKHWFAVDPGFDAAIRAQFADRFADATQGRLEHWASTPQGWLALLIVLDQFSRNLYRHDPRAWAQDLLAQRLAVWGIGESYDRQLPPMQRVFAYMPLEHAEDIALQRRCVALFEALYHGVPPSSRHLYTDFLDYARKHQAVIERFGRFPHRNAMLGRTSTAEERTYLPQPGAGF